MKIGATKCGVDNPEFYNKDQAKNVFPFIVDEPRWLILAGPASGNEAQCFSRRWTALRVLGIEPNHEARTWQFKYGGWNHDWPLLPYALSNAARTQHMRLPHGYLESASLDPVHADSCYPEERVEVTTVTLDHLDSLFGPFEDAVLWMDIEGSEYKALQGAVELLRRRAFQLINVEMLTGVTEVMEGVPRILEGAGYRAVKDWNASEACRDRVYVKS